MKAFKKSMLLQQIKKPIESVVTPVLQKNKKLVGSGGTKSGREVGWCGGGAAAAAAWKGRRDTPSQ